MPIVPFLNIKGGVAKTTTAVAVAEYLACWGHDVLVIDADHQCAASDLLLPHNRVEQCEKRCLTVHDLFLHLLSRNKQPDTTTLSEFVSPEASNISVAHEHLSVIPGSIRIEDLGRRLWDLKNDEGYPTKEAYRSFERQRLGVLRRWLINRYKWIIVDCPPSIQIQVRMFLRICDGYVVPSVPDWLSVRGVDYLQDRLRRIGIKKRALGLVWTLYREIEVHRHMVRTRGQVEGFVLPRPFHTIIHHAVAISRSTEPDERRKTHSTFCQKYESRFASKFENLTRELVAVGLKSGAE
jgi:chromosome partitioning protein